MKELWSRTFELFRRHTSLWVPCAVATLAMLALARLDKAAISLAFRWFMTERSALGGVVPSNAGEAEHRARFVVYPLGLCREFLGVCAFVVAFAVTAKLVGMIIEEQRPGLMGALRGIAPRWRGILLFSLQYMVVNGVALAVVGLLILSPTASGRARELAASKVLLYAMGLVWEGCLAWLLVRRWPLLTWR